MCLLQKANKSQIACVKTETMSMFLSLSVSLTELLLFLWPCAVSAVYAVSDKHMSAVKNQKNHVHSALPRPACTGPGDAGIVLWPVIDALTWVCVLVHDHMSFSLAEGNRLVCEIWADTC